MNTPSTRSRLIVSAAHLFRLHGYHGAGIAEILTHSNAPKGSLYHHFPNGKSDLARAAVHLVSEEMLGIINTAFGNAANYSIGATTFCHKVAKLFDLNVEWQSCPLSTMLFDGQGNDNFRDTADHILIGWNDRITFHALRLGMTDQRARTQSELLLMTLQGAWTIARARRSSDPIRRIPEYLFG